MATLVAIGYPDQGTAEQAMATVQQLESDLIIQADQVAAISRDLEGKYHVHTTHGGASAGGGAVWGGFWGLLYLRIGRIAPLIVSHVLWDLAVFLLLPFR